MAPWEKYQQPAAGPWAKYAQSAPVEQAAAQPEQPGFLQSAGEAVSDFGSTLKNQGLSFNLGDEAFGALNTPVEMAVRAYTGEDAGKGIGERISGAYTAGRDWRREQDEAARKRSPIASTVGEIAGGMLTGGGAAKAGMTLLNAGKATIPGMVARGAGEGAAYGAVHGFGSGEGLDDSIDQAVMGGAVGTVTGGGVGALAGKMAQSTASKAIPTRDAVTRRSDSLYKAAKSSGVTLNPATSARLADEIKVALDGAAFHPRIHPKVAAAFDEVVGEAGNPLDLQRVDHLRRIAGAAAKSNEADERRVASAMIDKMDDFADALTPADVSGSNPASAVGYLKEARRLWSIKRKDEMIADALERAERRAASTGSGGNVDNAIRQNIRSILDNPKKVRGFSKEERALMERIVRGGAGQNTLRLIGKLSPQGNGLMAALGLGATVANPVMAAAPAAGLMAKSIADRITPANVARLSGVVRSGGRTPTPQLTGPQEAMIRALLTGSSQQGPDAVRGMIP
jgi:hypothetical protein